jgi:hypothetical protein
MYAREMFSREFEGRRGRLIVQEGQSGELWVSWWPNQDGPSALPPGALDPERLNGFPYDAAKAERWDEVLAWIEAQPWAHPLPDRGNSIPGDPAAPDACPNCGTEVPARGTHGHARALAGDSQGRDCSSCASAARLAQREARVAAQGAAHGPQSAWLRRSSLVSKTVTRR